MRDKCLLALGVCLVFGASLVQAAEMPTDIQTELAAVKATREALEKVSE